MMRNDWERLYVLAGELWKLAAWKWLVYLTEQVPMFDMPARRSLAESQDFTADVGDEVASAARRSAENVTLISPNMVQLGEDLQYFHQVVLDIVSGDATAQEALDWAQSQIDGP